MSKEANASQPLIGRESTTVPGRFGEPLTVEHSVTSRGGFDQHAAHPLFLCLHGWGSSEEDMADIMRLIAPYNDFVALRGPLTLAPAREGSLDPGNYAWFHDALPIGDDRDYDAYAAANAEQSGQQPDQHAHHNHNRDAARGLVHMILFSMCSSACSAHFAHGRTVYDRVSHKRPRCPIAATAAPIPVMAADYSTPEVMSLSSSHWRKSANSSRLTL